MDEEAVPKAETKQGKDDQASDSYTYESYEEGDEHDGDEGNEDPNEEEIPLQASTLEEYYTKRVFILYIILQAQKIL